MKGRENTPVGDSPEQLPTELLWADGGHVSDVVLTCLADGQHAIVPAEAAAHVERCETCLAHLGHSALLSLETRRLLLPERRPVPRIAVALGLVTAALGLVPWLIEGPGTTREVSTVTRTLAFLSRIDASPSSSLGIAITYVTAACLVLAGLAFARFNSKKEVSQ